MIASYAPKNKNLEEKSDLIIGFMAVPKKLPKWCNLVQPFAPFMSDNGQQLLSGEDDLSSIF